jgi:hypothetical protein
MPVRNGHFPCQPTAHKHDQAMTGAIGLHSLNQRRSGAHHALLIIPALVTLVSCSQTPAKPVRLPIARESPVGGNSVPQINTPPAKSDRVISIHAIDTEYHGSTAVLPDNRLDHQKGSHD